MKIIKPYSEILSHTPGLEKVIERAGRTCYKSEDRITDNSAAAFIAMIDNAKHESVLEHGSITVLIVCDRGVSHELVRHRIASFSQESTRYCNYSKEKFGNEITVIQPCFWEEDAEDTLSNFNLWYTACAKAESMYFELLKNGATAQQARSVLPNSLKTEVVITANPREWRHIFKLRTSKAAHPQMREIMIPLLEVFKATWPNIFNNIVAE